MGTIDQTYQFSDNRGISLDRQWCSPRGTVLPVVSNVDSPRVPVALQTFELDAAGHFGKSPRRRHRRPIYICMFLFLIGLLMYYGIIFYKLYILQDSTFEIRSLHLRELCARNIQFSGMVNLGVPSFAATGRVSGLEAKIQDFSGQYLGTVHLDDLNVGGTGPIDVSGVFAAEDPEPLGSIVSMLVNDSAIPLRISTSLTFTSPYLLFPIPIPATVDTEFIMNEGAMPPEESGGASGVDYEPSNENEGLGNTADVSASFSKAIIISSENSDVGLGASIFLDVMNPSRLTIEFPDLSLRLDDSYGNVVALASLRASEFVTGHTEFTADAAIPASSLEAGQTFIADLYNGDISSILIRGSNLTDGECFLQTVLDAAAFVVEVMEQEPDSSSINTDEELISESSGSSVVDEFVSFIMVNDINGTTVGMSANTTVKANSTLSRITGAIPAIYLDIFDHSESRVGTVNSGAFFVDPDRATLEHSLLIPGAATSAEPCSLVSTIIERGGIILTMRGSTSQNFASQLLAKISYTLPVPSGFENDLRRRLLDSENGADTSVAVIADSTPDLLTINMGFDLSEELLDSPVTFRIAPFRFELDYEGRRLGILQSPSLISLGGKYGNTMFNLTLSVSHLEYDAVVAASEDISAFDVNEVDGGDCSIDSTLDNSFTLSWFLGRSALGSEVPVLTDQGVVFESWMPMNIQIGLNDLVAASNSSSANTSPGTNTTESEKKESIVWIGEAEIQNDEGNSSDSISVVVPIEWDLPFSVSGSIPQLLFALSGNNAVQFGSVSTKPILLYPSGFDIRADITIDDYEELFDGIMGGGDIEISGESSLLARYVADNVLSSVVNQNADDSTSAANDASGDVQAELEDSGVHLSVSTTHTDAVTLMSFDGDLDFVADLLDDISIELFVGFLPLASVFFLGSDSVGRRGANDDDSSPFVMKLVQGGDENRAAFHQLLEGIIEYGELPTLSLNMYKEGISDPILQSDDFEMNWSTGSASSTYEDVETMAAGESPTADGDAPGSAALEFVDLFILEFVGNTSFRAQTYFDTGSDFQVEIPDLSFDVLTGESEDDAFNKTPLTEIVAKLSSVAQVNVTVQNNCHPLTSSYWNASVQAKYESANEVYSEISSLNADSGPDVFLGIVGTSSYFASLFSYNFTINLSDDSQEANKLKRKRFTRSVLADDNEAERWAVTLNVSEHSWQHLSAFFDIRDMGMALNSWVGYVEPVEVEMYYRTQHVMVFNASDIVLSADTFTLFGSLWSPNGTDSCRTFYEDVTCRGDSNCPPTMELELIGGIGTPDSDFNIVVDWEPNNGQTRRRTLEGSEDDSKNNEWAELGTLVLESIGDESIQFTLPLNWTVDIDVSLAIVPFTVDVWHEGSLLFPITCETSFMQQNSNLERLVLGMSNIQAVSDVLYSLVTGTVEEFRFVGVGYLLELLDFSYDFGHDDSDVFRRRMLEDGILNDDVLSLTVTNNTATAIAANVSLETTISFEGLPTDIYIPQIRVDGSYSTIGHAWLWVFQEILFQKDQPLQFLTSEVLLLDDDRAAHEAIVEDWEVIGLDNFYVAMLCGPAEEPLQFATNWKHERTRRTAAAGINEEEEAESLADVELISLSEIGNDHVVANVLTSFDLPLTVKVVVPPLEGNVLFSVEGASELVNSSHPIEIHLHSNVANDYNFTAIVGIDAQAFTDTIVEALDAPSSVRFQFVGSDSAYFSSIMDFTIEYIDGTRSTSFYRRHLSSNSDDFLLDVDKVHLSVPVNSATDFQLDTIVIFDWLADLPPIQVTTFVVDMIYENQTEHACSALVSDMYLSSNLSTSLAMNLTVSSASVESHELFVSDVSDGVVGGLKVQIFSDDTLAPISFETSGFLLEDLQRQIEGRSTFKENRRLQSEEEAEIFRINGLTLQSVGDASIDGQIGLGVSLPFELRVDGVEVSGLVDAEVVTAGGARERANVTVLLGMETVSVGGGEGGDSEDIPHEYSFVLEVGVADSQQVAESVWSYVEEGESVTLRLVGDENYYFSSLIDTSVDIGTSDGLGSRMGRRQMSSSDLFSFSAYDTISSVSFALEEDSATRFVVSSSVVFDWLESAFSFSVPLTLVHATYLFDETLLDHSTSSAVTLQQTKFLPGHAANLTVGVELSSESRTAHEAFIEDVSSGSIAGFEVQVVTENAFRPLVFRTRGIALEQGFGSTSNSEETSSVSSSTSKDTYIISESISLLSVGDGGAALRYHFSIDSDIDFVISLLPISFTAGAIFDSGYYSYHVPTVLHFSHMPSTTNSYVIYASLDLEDTAADPTLYTSVTSRELSELTLSGDENSYFSSLVADDVSFDVTGSSVSFRRLLSEDSGVAIEFMDVAFPVHTYDQVQATAACSLTVPEYDIDFSVVALNGSVYYEGYQAGVFNIETVMLPAHTMSLQLDGIFDATEEDRSGLTALLTDCCTSDLEADFNEVSIDLLGGNASVPLELRIVLKEPEITRVSRQQSEDAAFWDGLELQRVDIVGGDSVGTAVIAPCVIPDYCNSTSPSGATGITVRGLASLPTWLSMEFNSSVNGGLYCCGEDELQWNPLVYGKVFDFAMVSDYSPDVDGYLTATVTDEAAVRSLISSGDWDGVYFSGDVSGNYLSYLLSLFKLDVGELMGATGSNEATYRSTDSSFWVDHALTGTSTYWMSVIVSLFNLGSPLEEGVLGIGGIVLQVLYQEQSVGTIGSQAPLELFAEKTVNSYLDTVLQAPTENDAGIELVSRFISDFAFFEPGHRFALSGWLTPAAVVPQVDSIVFQMYFEFPEESVEYDEVTGEPLPSSSASASEDIILGVETSILGSILESFINLEVAVYMVMYIYNPTNIDFSVGRVKMDLYMRDHDGCYGYWFLGDYDPAEFTILGDVDENVQADFPAVTESSGAMTFILDGFESLSRVYDEYVAKGRLCVTVVNGEAYISIQNESDPPFSPIFYFYQEDYPVDDENACTVGAATSDCEALTQEFLSGIHSVQTNGDARISNSVLYVVDGSSELGSAFWETPVSMQSAFVAEFSFEVDTSSWLGNAEGFAFVVQATNDGTGALGSGSDGDYSHGFIDIGSRSVGVIFNVYATNSLSVHVSGSGDTLDSTESIPNIDDGETHTATIEYRPAELSVSVSIDDVFIFTVGVDFTVLGDSFNAWVGFTGKTGSFFYSTIKIHSFAINKVITSTEHSTWSSGETSHSLGVANTYHIHSRDSCGYTRMEGGDAWESWLILVDTGEVVSASLVDNGDGTYTATYVPNAYGKYDVHGSLDGVAVLFGTLTIGSTT
eukprot:Rmarinus@m.86